MVNYTKARPLKYVYLQSFAEKWNQIMKILHTEARWLSRGKALPRVYELKEEMLALLVLKDKENFVICFAMTAGSSN